MHNSWVLKKWEFHTNPHWPSFTQVPTCGMLEQGGVAEYSATPGNIDFTLLVCLCARWCSIKTVQLSDFWQKQLAAPCSPSCDFSSICSCLPFPFPSRDQNKNEFLGNMVICGRSAILGVLSFFCDYWHANDWLYSQIVLLHLLLLLLPTDLEQLVNPGQSG